MNYTSEESLRGGGNCCKNKNKNKTLNSSNDQKILNYNEESYPADFSSLNNDFSELEDFQDTKDEEEASWNFTEDDYESMNPEGLEDEDDEEVDAFLDQYLLSMSPIIDEKTRNRGEKGNKGTTLQRTVPRRPHDVSVKCSDSTEEIIGTPSEVALRLSEAIQNYLPRRKMKIENEVSNEAAVALDEEFEKEPEEEDESVENLCPEEEPPYIPEARGCPGTWDRLRKKNVPCADALTLREIALGRRVKRPENSSFVLPVDDRYETDRQVQPIPRTNEIGEKKSCCCSKKKKRDAKKDLQPAPKSCCTKQTRNNKSVSFSF